MSRVLAWVVLTGYRAGWAIVCRLPTRAAYRLFDLIASGMHRRGGKSVSRLRSNYARVRPELDPEALDRLVHDGLRSYLRYWCEAFRLPVRDTADLVAQVEVRGDVPVRAELQAGRGVACFLGHLGNWDTAGAWSTTQLWPVTTVAERLRPEELFTRFVAFRESLGMTILPLTGAGNAFAGLKSAIAEGALVPLLADRDLTRTGVVVDFVGLPARMAPGPAALALATGAALFPVSVHYEPVPQAVHESGFRLVITFHDRVWPPENGAGAERIQAMTQACADALGETVRTRTEDWHMMQRVFVADLADG
ncbi:MAG TPA: phosphatidylinositol mannoside acyltransferase [Dermatophilaceae bacterium]|nr:phosphatidylinositol mannoside acyltransferase [Dermatophilaceae bacterium]